MRSRLPFLALSAAVAAGGCAGVKTPPPPTRDHPNAVTLQVQAQAGNYTCMFSGGDDHAGNVTVRRSEGDVNIHVNLTTANYSIYALSFRPPDSGQLTYHLENRDMNAVVHDNNTADIDVYYGVLIADLGTNANPELATKFLCDPRIVNN